MYELYLGEILTRYRGDYNINQEKLCYGVCSLATLSRIETYSNTKNIFLINHLLERMGLYDDLIINLLDDDNFEQYERAMEIRRYIGEKDYTSATQMLQYYEEEIDGCENIHMQFVYRNKGEIEKESGNLKVAREWYEKALEMTLPNFDSGNVDKYYLSSQELDIVIECMLLKDEVEGKYVDIEFAYKLLRSAEWLSAKELGKNRTYPKLCLICAEKFFEIGEYHKSDNILKRALYALSYTNDPTFRAELIYLSALVSLKLDSNIDVTEKLLCAYYMADILDQNEFANEIENKVREVYGWRNIDEVPLLG